MRIVVLGGLGMLGHKMFQVLRARFPGTLCTTRVDVRQPPFDRIELLQGDDVICGVDVMDCEKLHEVLADVRPDVIVNCTGIIKQREESQLALPSISVNAMLPHLLAKFAEEWGARVIHPSTDCVFDGNRGRYLETDQSNATDLYGKSKFLGELHGASAITLRTSIIGRELTGRRSLLEWLLSQNGRRVRGFRRVIYSGVTTNELAAVVAMVIERYPQLHGLYQVVSDATSKYDLLCLLRDAFNADIEIVPVDDEVSDRSMIGEKFRRATGYVAPPWSVLATQLAADPTPYANWTRSLS